VTKKKPDIADLSFEDALAEIEGIIERIESGETGLEQSITEYERGARLIRRCREVLDRAEKQIEDVTSGLLGSTEGEPKADEGGTPTRPR
jgi:exodeoxyribonuclease VII small subunit